MLDRFIATLAPYLLVLATAQRERLYTRVAVEAQRTARKG